MKDFFGQPIEVGDLVYCIQTTSTGRLRTIKKFNKDNTKALCTRDSYFYYFDKDGRNKTGTIKESRKESKWFLLHHLIKAPDGYEQGN